MGRVPDTAGDAADGDTPERPGRERVTADDFSAAVSAITSAFGDQTRREIYLYAHEHGPGVTASAVAEHFGLHPNVARHHLDKLAAGGYLEVRLERQAPHGAGRPSKHYRVTAPDITLEFPVRREGLLSALLARALEHLPDDQAAAMAEDVGEDYGRAMARHLGPGEHHRSFRAALHAVADALTAHGFAAHTVDSELTIVSEHCPFGQAAIDHPVICAVDRGMVRGMLAELYGDTAPEIEASRALGDDHCVTTF